MNLPSSRSASWLAFLVKCLLVLLPVLMIYGHLRSVGAVWNHVTKATFNPVTNYVSDYAYRCPAWWAIVACIHLFGLFFGYVSWQAMNRKRSFLSWVVVIGAAITMYQLEVVAFYPVKSPELSISRLESELNKGPLDKLEELVWRKVLELTGNQVPKSVPLSTYVAQFQSDRMHLGGIEPAWLLMIVTMGGSFFVWRKHGASPAGWRKAHALVAALILTALIGIWRKPEWVGLFQRLSFVAVYVWMWAVFRAMEREERHEIPSASPDGPC